MEGATNTSASLDLILTNSLYSDRGFCKYLGGLAVGGNEFENDALLNGV